MISAFICANIYGQLLVCAVKRTAVYNQPAVYEVLMTDNKWYLVNRCTGELAVKGQPLKKKVERKWCF